MSARVKLDHRQVFVRLRQLQYIYSLPKSVMYNIAIFTSLTAAQTFHQTLHTIIVAISLQIYHYVTHYNKDDNQ